METLFEWYIYGLNLFIIFDRKEDKLTKIETEFR